MASLEDTQTGWRTALASFGEIMVIGVKAIGTWGVSATTVLGGIGEYRNKEDSTNRAGHSFAAGIDW